MEEYCLHLNVFMSFSNENCHGKTGNVGIFFKSPEHPGIHLEQETILVEVLLTDLPYQPLFFFTVGNTAVSTVRLHIVH